MAEPKSYSFENLRNGFAEFGSLGVIENGGKGSGNFGHAGRPGKVGGSGSGQGGDISLKDMQKILQPSHDRYTREFTEVKYNPKKDRYEAESIVHFRDGTPDTKEFWWTGPGKDPKDKMSWFRDNNPTYWEELADRIDRAHGGRKNMVELNGGKGSGNFGHSGRPGKRGGSGNGQGKAVDKKTRSAIDQLENLMLSEGEYPDWVGGVFDSLLQGKAKKSDVADLRDYYLGDDPSERSLDEFDKLLKKLGN